jgi:lysophospholipase L1-like esterase
MSRRRRTLRLASALLGIGLFLLLGEGLSAVALQFLDRPRPLSEFELRMPALSGWKARDETLPRQKPWQRRRIVCIGDSCTYGLGLHAEEAYPKQLERLLNEKAGGNYQHFEVLNLGVPGHSSYKGLLLLRELALSFHPDLVIAYFGHNDKWRSELTDQERDARERSMAASSWGLARALLEHSHLFRLLRLGIGQLLSAGKTRFGHLEVSYRVPLEEYRQNLQSIARETRASGADILFLSLPENPAIEQLSAEGIAAYERGDVKQAARTLQQVADIRLMYYPRPMYYLSLAYQALGQEAKARKAMKTATQFAAIFPFPVLLQVPLERVGAQSCLDGVVLRPEDHFDIYARYRQAMAEVAAAEGVPLVELGPEELPASDFFDYCHLLPSGNAKIAQALAGPVSARAALRHS